LVFDGLPFVLDGGFIESTRFAASSLAADICAAVGPTFANMYTNSTFEGYMQSVTAIEVATI